MDWAKTVRTLRTKLRLKQGTLADLIGVSQTYVSRLEAGAIEPAPDVAEALNKLRENPQTRSVFDDFTASVRYSPFHCALYESTEDGFVRVAASLKLDAGMPDLTVALADDFATLRKAGLEDGQLSSADGVWHQNDDGTDRFWTTHFTPVRDETGGWFLHLTLNQIAGDAHARILAERDAPLYVTLHRVPAVLA